MATRLAPLAAPLISEERAPPAVTPRFRSVVAQVQNTMPTRRARHETRLRLAAVALCGSQTLPATPTPRPTWAQLFCAMGARSRGGGIHQRQGEVRFVYDRARLSRDRHPTIVNTPIRYIIARDPCTCVRSLDSRKSCFANAACTNWPIAHHRPHVPTHSAPGHRALASRRRGLAKNHVLASVGVGLSTWQFWYGPKGTQGFGLDALTRWPWVKTRTANARRGRPMEVFER